MSMNDSDLIERLHAVAEGFEMQPAPPVEDVQRGRRRVRRNRAMVAVAAVGAVALIAVGGGLAAGTLGSSEQPSPIEEPTGPSSESPTVQESADPSPVSIAALTAELDAILTQVPGWAVTEEPDYTGYDYAFNGRCARRLSWGEDATGGGDGGLSVAGIGHLGFRSEARASDAAARLVDRLESCTTTEWRTQPIAQTGAVLASSSDAVAWIQQDGDTVSVLQVPTADGPPPPGVQVEVVEFIDAYRAWQEQN